MTSAFNESTFQSRVDEVLKTVRTVLDTTKNPQRPADVAHQWDDKYQVVERGVRNGVSATLNSLDLLGANADVMDKMIAWTMQHRSVTMCLDSTEKCTFIKKASRDVESATKHVTEYEGTFFGKEKVTHKTVTTITEWFWKYEWTYSLNVYPGTSTEQAVKLQGRTGKCEIITTSENSPKPETRVCSPISVNLNWLLERLVTPTSAAKAKAGGSVLDLVVTWEIDRKLESCHTPRRNNDVERMLSFFSSLHSWCGSVASYMRNTVFPTQALDKLDMAAINDSGIFVPVAPLMLPAPGDQSDAKGAFLAVVDERALLNEQRRSLEAKLGALAKAFPDSSQLVTVAEANVLAILAHVQQTSERTAHIVDYIEALIEKQLVAAVGKTLTAKDFGAYMNFHNRKLFAPQYAPSPFVYAVRRPDHCPEGVISIEADLHDGALPQPINTMSCTRTAPANKPLFFQLGAATRAAFVGEQSVHGVMFHQFSGDTGPTLRLVARARQFSSFVLLIGKMISVNTFEPSHGIIIQNKDELFIPLLTEQIPSASQFRDAIDSLSPEMQRFAKAYRAMQLESSMFALVVIQIKPQMEMLLNLPQQSLTKQIRLTQDLMEMFITYQIPSDLMSYEGDANMSVSYKVDSVKSHIKQLQDLIQDMKNKELKEVGEQAAYAVMSRIAGTAGAGSSGGVVLAGAPIRQQAYARTQSTSVNKGAAAAQTPEQKAAAEAAALAAEGVLVDYTKLPALIDARLDSMARGSAVRPTSISVSNDWRKKYQKKLLSQPEETGLSADQLHNEKNRAFDLLDALSRSGALPFAHASLHIVIAATHCFDKSLMHTVTRDNINPIERAEAVSCVIAATLHAANAPTDVIRDSERDRLTTYSPKLKIANF